MLESDTAGLLLLLFLCRRPQAANQQVVSKLSAAQKAALAAAAEQAELFAANPTTDAIHDSLIASVLQTGSLAGMLRRKAGPLLHCGYALPPFELRVDLAWLNMTATEAQGYSNSLLQRIEAANSRLFGPQPAAPQRPVLLQNLVDLWCCDWDGVKLTFASPAAQGAATTAAATAAVLSSLLSAARVAQAVARGDQQAADRAAAATAALAGAAANHVQQLQAITAQPAAAAAVLGGASNSQAGVSEQAAPAAVDTAGVQAAGAQLALAAVAAVPAGARSISGDTLPAVPLLLGTGTQQAAAASGPGSSGLQPAAAITLEGAAAGAAKLAAQLGRAVTPATQTLRRGAGLLVLFDDSWGGKARQLMAGRAVVSGREYSHYSVLQLMTTEGLLLQEGYSQTVSVRVAGEYLAAEQPRTGHWSKAQHSLSITPGHNLLLSCQPSHTWGKNFTASCPAATRSYLALFDGFSDAEITAVLGEQRGQSFLQSHFRIDLVAFAVVSAQQIKKGNQVGVVGLLLPHLEQFPCSGCLASPQILILDAQLADRLLQLGP